MKKSIFVVLCLLMSGFLFAEKLDFKNLNFDYTYDDVVQLVNDNGLSVDSKTDNRIICSKVQIDNVNVDKVHFVFLNEKLDTVYVINKKNEDNEKFVNTLQLKYETKNTRYVNDNYRVKFSRKNGFFVVEMKRR